MKNDHKESKRSRILNDASRNPENERNINSDEDRKQREERRKRSEAEQEKASNALSQGYFPDGPGGNYTGA
jgi:hypothetical protein